MGKRPHSDDNDDSLPIHMKAAKCAKRSEERSLTPIPDSTCNPASLGLTTGHSAALPFYSNSSTGFPSSAWQHHYAQTYMNYLYPQTASWMFSRFPVASNYPPLSLPSNTTTNTKTNTNFL